MIIRGVNVFPTQIEEHILALGSLSPHYLIELERRGNLDHMTVNVELAPGSNSSSDDVAGALQQRIKAHVGVSCQINIRDTGGIARSEGKAKRVIDRRKE
jgi:phenylacetate-CoA ligase